jgi:hypothetical protein
MAEAKRENSPAWAGVQALAVILNGLTGEGGFLERKRFVRELESIGVDAERVIGGMLASGLFETSKVNDKVALQLTNDGVLVFIHAGVRTRDSSPPYGVDVTVPPRRGDWR